jgi:hypothetical protein
MAFTTTSKYLQLTPWLLMEYMYADNPNPETYTVNEVGYNRLVNGYMNGDIQAYNLNDDYQFTSNTASVSVVQLNDTKFVTLNSNLIVPFNDYSTELTPTSETQVTFPSNITVTYDSVRYWILAGYNLSEIDGVIAQIQYQDQDLSYVTISQILLQRASADAYTFSPSPLSIGSTIYDKYFELSIPSLSSMNDAYQAASAGSKSSQLSAILSKSGTGFVVNAPIKASLYSIGSIQTQNGYATYLTSLNSVASIEPQDPFSEVAAYIAPSPGGQFFEYFGTYDGGFIEDFILFQNSIGNAYVISHQIELFEQIGAALIETSNFTSLQTTGYDIPNLYRPIVRNASVAASFTLRYTMTLVNNANQDRIVRISSYTSTNPHQYGTNIQPIVLSTFPQVQKIYNKVYTPPAIQLSSDVFSSQLNAREVVRLNNVYVTNANITLGITNLIVNGNTVSQDPSGSSSTERIPFYAKGQAEIDILPFDNYFKFTAYQNTGNGSPKAINFDSGGVYYMYFIDNKGDKFLVPNISNVNLANPAKGEIAFKVDESSSTRILQFIKREFYIANRPPQQNESTSSTTTVSTSQSVSDVRGTSLNTSAQTINAIYGIGESSVVYWGYWKPVGEQSRFTVGVTGATGPIRVNTLRGETGPVKGDTKTPEITLLKGIQPVNPVSEYTIDNSTTVKIPEVKQLTLDQRISAASSQVSAYVSESWPIQKIIDYFLKPGSPGTITYALTKGQFKQAVTGIFSDVDISILDNSGNTNSGKTNGGPASTKGKVNQTGAGNYDEENKPGLQ